MCNDIIIIIKDFKTFNKVVKVLTIKNNDN